MWQQGLFLLITILIKIINFWVFSFYNKQLNFKKFKIAAVNGGKVAARSTGDNHNKYQARQIECIDIIDIDIDKLSNVELQTNNIFKIVNLLNLF